MKLGFVGLGKMGLGMAGMLQQAGHELTVYNRTREKGESLKEKGARIADTPAEAARGAEAVFSMLSDDEALTEVVLGKDGIAQGLTPGAIHISCSTISTSLSRRLTNEHQERTQEFVSAPVFGRPEAASAKKLIVVLAGQEQSLERCLPLAEAIGRRTISVGREPWMANAVKLCGNFMIASMLEAFAEAFAVMQKSGVPQQDFLDTMVELFGSSVYANYGAAIVNKQFDPAGFALKLGLKDVRLALELSGEVEAAMPFASIVRDHLVSALAHGQGSLDWSSLALVAERRAGLNQDSDEAERLFRR